MTIRDLLAFTPRTAAERNDKVVETLADFEIEVYSEEDLIASDPHYMPVVYVDKEKLHKKFELSHIYEHYRNHPLNLHPYVRTPREIDINIQIVTSDALRSFRLSNWPAAEALFEDRGYVSPLEVRYAGAGGQRDSRFLREHLKWLDVSTFVLDEMLKVRGDKFFKWREDYVGNPADKKLFAQFLKDKRLEVLGPLSGKASDQNLNERLRDLDGDLVQAPYRPNLLQDLDYALIEHEGLLLGCNDVRLNDRIHLAEKLTPLTSLKRCRDEFAKTSLERRADRFAGPLPFGERTRDVAAQIHFEMRPAAADSFFASCHFYSPDTPRKAEQRTGSPRDNVRLTDAILIWYSQVHVVLRKAVWVARLPENPTMARDELRREADAMPSDGRRRPIPVGANRPVYRPRNEAALDPINTVLQRHLKPLQKQYERTQAALNSQGQADPNKKEKDRPKFTADRLDPGLSDEEYLTARFFGLSVGSPYGGERPAIDEVVATWLGRLKREGQQSINWLVAEAIWAVMGDRDRPDDFFTCLLSHDAWQAVVAVALDVIETDEATNVRYVWSRDWRNPWTVGRCKNGVLEIRGPLLSFPALRSAYWLEKATFIQKNTDFRVDRKPG